MLNTFKQFYEKQQQVRDEILAEGRDALGDGVFYLEKPDSIPRLNFFLAGLTQTEDLRGELIHIHNEFAKVGLGFDVPPEDQLPENMQSGVFNFPLYRWGLTYGQDDQGNVVANDKIEEVLGRPLDLRFEYTEGGPMGWQLFVRVV